MTANGSNTSAPVTTAQTAAIAVPTRFDTGVVRPVAGFDSGEPRFSTDGFNDGGPDLGGDQGLPFGGPDGGG